MNRSLLALLMAIKLIDAAHAQFGYGLIDPQPQALPVEANEWSASSTPTFDSSELSKNSRNPLPSNQVSSMPSDPNVVYEAGELLAIVGDEPILLGSVLPLVESKLDQIKDRIPPSQLEQARQQLIRKVLQDAILTKALAQRFVRDSVGIKPRKDYIAFREQMLPRATKIFYTQHIPSLMKQLKVETEQELDEQLRSMGTSIAAQHAAFADQVLADEAIRSHVPKRPHVDLDSMRTYYSQNEEKYRRPARAKWRQLTVLFEKHSNKAEALQKISEMGNEILFGGTSFEAVAKRSSDGPMASKGGLFDWTSKGALKSKIIDEHVFSLPLNRLSRIIEDDVGYHIIEVLDRENEFKIPFSETQEEIRKEIERRKQTELRREFIDKVLEETNIWSRWHQDFPGSLPLSEIVNLPDDIATASFNSASPR